MQEDESFQRESDSGSNGTFEGRVAVDGKRVSVYGNTVTEVKKKIAETSIRWNMAFM